MSVEKILQKLNGVRKSQHGHLAKCPAHHDEHQSLAVSDNGGKVLLNCFAGCPTEKIISELGIEWKELFSDGNGRADRPAYMSFDSVSYFGSPKKIKAVYGYTDEHGNLLYENVRYEPKDFRQRHFDGKGAPVWNLNGVRRVPYRLRQLCLNHEADVWLAEGEKDADSLWELGFVTSSFKNWTPEFNKYIRGKHVIIVRDHDVPGGVQANEAARIVAEDAASVKIFDVFEGREMPEKQGPDITNYIHVCVKDEGMSREEIGERLCQMVDRCDVWRDGQNRDLFLIKSGNEWLRQASQRPRPKKLFGECWYDGELCILFADTNVGKSILAVQIADAVSKGVPVETMELETHAQPVVYFDFELTDKQFESRFSVAAAGSEFFTDHYRFHDNFKRAEINPETSDLSGFPSFEEYLNHELDKSVRKTGAKVLIVDNLTYLRDETENARNALPLMKYLKELKSRYNLSILALAHTPKRDSSKILTRNDLQGSKMLINFCDSSFAIGESQKVPDMRYIKQIKARNSPIIYHTENVLLCTVEKPHNFVQFRFLETANEREHLRPAGDKDKAAMIARARELQEAGRSQREIASELGVSVSTVNNYLKH